MRQVRDKFGNPISEGDWVKANGPRVSMEGVVIAADPDTQNVYIENQNRRCLFRNVQIEITKPRMN